MHKQRPNTTAEGCALDFENIVPHEVNEVWRSTSVMSSMAEGITSSKAEVGCSRTGSNEEQAIRVRLFIWVEIRGRKRGKGAAKR